MSIEEKTQNCEKYKINREKLENVFIPAINENSWRCLLADPEKQWVDNYSAKETYKSWKNGLPEKIKNTLSEHFGKVELLFAFPEFKVDLESAKRPSQNDVFAIIRNYNELISLTVEAKCKEDFDLTIAE